jgi:polyhydroxyalkanoate synthase
LPVFLQMALQILSGQPARLSAVLRGLRAYQDHPYRRTLEPLPVVAEAGHARLLDFGGPGRPALFVPSLVNGADVLDLMPERSLLRWLAGNGVRPLLLDWGHPRKEDATLSIDEHVTERLLPLMEALGEPVQLVGYCLGGTMTMAAAQLAPCSRLALIATPWHYSGLDATRRQGLGALWKTIEPFAASAGLIPMDVLQPGFWELNGERSVTKFEGFGAQDQSRPEAAMFVALEDWANGGPALTAAAAEQLLERFCHQDETGSGGWRIDGQQISPDRLSLPVLNIGASQDRLVPATAMAPLGERRVLDGGHVGIIVGSRARVSLWEPLRSWLAA